MGELFIFDSRAQAIELAGDQPSALLFWIGDYGNARVAFQECAQEAMVNYALVLAQAAETLWMLGTTRHLDTIERCVRAGARLPAL
jgi:hypothetical protein